MAKDKVIPSNLVLCNEKFKYDNIEQMVNDTGLQLDNVVELLGYYKAGDGAGHQRIIASEDDGSGVQLGNGLWANIIHNGEVNVNWFGAKGDGVTDDTEIIEKALNSKANNCVFGLNRKYKIQSRPTGIKIDSNKNIDLNGSTILYIIPNDGNSFRIINITEKENIKLYNGIIKTNYEDNLSRAFHISGIVVIGSSYCEISNIEFFNLGVENQTSGNHQIVFLVEDDSTKDCCFNHVHDCIFHGLYDAFNVRAFTPWKTTTTHSVYNIIVENCLFKKSTKSCFEMAGNKTHNCIARNCIIEECGTEGMDIDKNAYNCIIDNVVIKKCIGSSEVSGIIPYGGFSIQTNPEGDRIAENNIIRNCTVENTLGYGFLVSGCKNFILENNNTIVCVNGIHITKSDRNDGADNSPQGIIRNNNISANEIGISNEIGGYIDIENNIINTKIGIRYTNTYKEDCKTILSSNTINHSERAIWLENINSCIIEKNIINGSGEKDQILLSKTKDIICDKNTFSSLSSGQRDILVVVEDGNKFSFCFNTLSVLTSSAINIISESQTTLKVLYYKGNTLGVQVSDNITIEKGQNDDGLLGRTIEVLSTPTMQYAMELEGVKQDYLEYSLEKFKYDKQLEEEQKAKYEAYELLLKDNPNLTWEEFEQQYGSNVMMNLSLVERLEEPVIPESVKKFMEKYL